MVDSSAYVANDPWFKNQLVTFHSESDDNQSDKDKNFQYLDDRNLGVSCVHTTAEDGAGTHIGQQVHGK